MSLSTHGHMSPVLHSDVIRSCRTCKNAFGVWSSPINTLDNVAVGQDDGVGSEPLNWLHPSSISLLADCLSQAWRSRSIEEFEYRSTRFMKSHTFQKKNKLVYFPTWRAPEQVIYRKAVTLTCLPAVLIRSPGGGISPRWVFPSSGPCTEFPVHHLLPGK